MQITPITGAVGAELSGLDLKRPISADLAQDLRKVLDQYLVVVICNQGLDATQHRHLCEIFGNPLINPYAPGPQAHPEMTFIIKEADDRSGVFGGGWHTDLSFLEQPPSGSVLCALEVPPYGGDTLFSNQQAAWDALAPPLREVLEHRNAIHVGKPYGIKWAPPLEEQSMRGATRRNDPDADRERFHPAVLTHPVTGRQALYINPTYTLRLDGMSEAESRPILESLFQHSVQPEFCCRIRWTKGMVVIWDNFSTQHYAVNDYHGYRRELRRIAFSGREITDFSNTP
jgi:taurine dioxygenase